MGIMGEMLLLVLSLLIIGNMAVESSDPTCTLTCDQQQSCEIGDEMVKIKSGDTFCVMPGNYSLQGQDAIIINNVTNVSIIGIGGMAIISCIKPVGVVVIDVEQFRMENITLDGCALVGEMWEQKVVPMMEQLLDLSNTYNIPGVVGKSLTIVASRDVTLCHVNVKNSVGVGLLALNIIGQCFLMYCTFDGIVDDDCSQSSGDLHCISGAAMFYLIDSKNGYAFSDNNILIDNCTFQNSVSHSNYVALKLSDGIFRLNVSLGNHSQYPLDGSAGLSVIMDRHNTVSRQYVIVRNSQ